jgi:hypothetical protein
LIVRCHARPLFVPNRLEKILASAPWRFSGQLISGRFKKRVPMYTLFWLLTGVNFQRLTDIQPYGKVTMFGYFNILELKGDS